MSVNRVITVIMAASFVAPAQPGTHTIVSGQCGSFRLDGAILLTGAACPNALDIYLPSNAERQAGKRATVRIQAPAPNAPALTLEIVQATQIGPLETIFGVRFEGGAKAPQPAPGHVLSCTYSRVNNRTGQLEEGLNCSLNRVNNAAGLVPNLFNFEMAADAATKDRFAGVMAGAFEMLNPGKKFQQSPNAPVVVSALQAPAGAAAPAAKSVPAPAANSAASTNSAASNDPKAIFGFLAGTPRPAMPRCRDDDYDNTMMPLEIPFCYSQGGSELSAFFGGLQEELSADDFEKMGLTVATVFVNGKVYDTKFTDNVTLYLDRANVIQRIKVTTRLVADADVISMLTNKYGKPGKQTMTTWTNPASRTPNYFWNFPNLAVDYYSRDINILNSKSPLGAIHVYTPAYSRMLADYQKRRGAPAPGKKGI